MSYCGSPHVNVNNIHMRKPRLAFKSAVRLFLRRPQGSVNESEDAGT